MFKIIWSALLAWKIARESNYSLNGVYELRNYKQVLNYANNRTSPHVALAGSLVAAGTEGLHLSMELT